jgi:hypothetical protein
MQDIRQITIHLSFRMLVNSNGIFVEVLVDPALKHFKQSLSIEIYRVK